MNLAHWLDRAAKRRPDAPALFLGHTAIADYRTLAAETCALARGFSETLGLRPGDRIAILLHNRPEYMTLLQAAWRVGAAVVPINAKLHARETAWIVADSRAGVLVCEDAEASALETACRDAGAAPTIIPVERLALLGRDGPEGEPAEREPDDLAWLFYTSGTTGRPKGVMISHANLQAMAFSYLADVDEVRGEDAAIYAAPVSHGAGLYSIQHVLRGARHVFPESQGFEAEEVFALASRLRDGHLFAAPTMVRRLTAHARRSGADGEGLRTIVYGGGPMYLVDLSEALDVLGPRFVQIYGQGECPMAITALSRETLAARQDPRWAARAASVGLAQSCVEVRVAAPDGSAAPPGEPGEVLVRGSAVMAGYWNNPQATANTLRDGWLWTGDVGALDADGYLTLRDRSKDLIISGGSNIYPREVEEALLAHAAVREVSVVGAPDAEWGEAVVAFVVAEAGATAESLDAHCRERIARFKRPKRYVFLPELPKNNYGKVLKTELRARLDDPAAPGRESAPPVEGVSRPTRGGGP